MGVAMDGAVTNTEQRRNGPCAQALLGEELPQFAPLRARQAVQRFTDGGDHVRGPRHEPLDYAARSTRAPIMVSSEATAATATDVSIEFQARNSRRMMSYRCHASELAGIAASAARIRAL